MNKILKYALIGLVAVVVIFGLLIGYVVTFLPKIPVKDIKVEKTAERIERGRYLANHVSVCIDCHSTRNWTKFSGPITPGTLGKGGDVFDEKVGMPGRYMAANITPFNLKDWTDGELYRTITSGVKKNSKIIFPIMPYLHYGQMDTEDVYSIIAYIRSLDPIQSVSDAAINHFPMNIIVHLIPKPANPTTRPDTNDRITYGKYIVNAAGCIDCHTRFVKGRMDEKMAFAGGRDFKMPFGVIYTANITPDMQTGIGKWTKEAFIRKFKSFDTQSGYVPAKVTADEFNSMMPWTMYSGMKTSDLSAIYDYLRTLPAISNNVVKVKFNTKQ